MERRKSNNIKIVNWALIISSLLKGNDNRPFNLWICCVNNDFFHPTHHKLLISETYY